MRILQHLVAPPRESAALFGLQITGALTRLRCLVSLLLFALLPAGAPPVSSAEKPWPVILDTDIGTDVDDAYALVLAARSPQLELRAVTTLYGKVSMRSAIARKLLLLMKNDAVPVASGQARPADGREPFWGGWEGKGILKEGESATGISPRSASELIVEILERSSEPVVIVAVGGLSNVAAALQRMPAIKSRIRRLVIMGGCVRPFVIQGKTLPERLETNLHNDPEAAVTVLQSGIPITLVPAEVTFKTKLLNADRERLRQASSPIAKAITAMTDEWEPRLAQFMKGFGVGAYYGDGAVMLHDPLAVATLLEPSLVKIVRERIRVEVENGRIRTISDPQGPCAIDLVIEADITRLSRLVSDAVIQ